MLVWLLNQIFWPASFFFFFFFNKKMKKKEKRKSRNLNQKMSDEVIAFIVSKVRRRPLARGEEIRKIIIIIILFLSLNN